MVWCQWNNSTADIYLYNGATTTNLTNNSSGISVSDPQINNNGQVVWYQLKGTYDSYCYNVYLYNGTTTTNLTNNSYGSYAQFPRINNSGQAVWYQDDPDGSSNIYLAVPCVNNQPPVVNAAGSQTATEGDVVTFTGSYTDEDQADSHTYSWDFGDGSASVTDTLTPSHNYADNGTYTVTLTVTDSAGNSSSDTLTVTVTNNAPEEPCIGAYTIDNLTNYSSGSYAYYPQINDNGQVVWHQWNGSTSANDVYLYNDTTSTTFNLTNNG
ncbi:MAG: PKD domain-containing protein, partial [Bacteroidota bacterium]